MENASKALLMAGSILIGIMLITLFVYMYSNTISMQTAYETELETNRINKINTSFMVYNGRKDITAQEIVTVYNLAQEYKNTDGITITVKVDDGIGTINDDRKMNLIKNYSINTTDNTVITYKVKKITLGTDGIVNKITFTQTP